MLVASGLPTSAKIALGVVAFAFIAFALISSFVLPRRNPNFPGERGLKAYILVAFGFFVAMILTVILVAKEPKESSAASSPTTRQRSRPPLPRRVRARPCSQRGRRSSRQRAA